MDRREQVFVSSTYIDLTKDKPRIDVDRDVLIAEDDNLLPEDFGGDEKVEVVPDSRKDVIVQLFTLGLIEHSVKKRQISDNARYWRLTSLGRDRLMQTRAIRRTQDQ